jgi:hypothetical protein
MSTVCEASDCYAMCFVCVQEEGAWQPWALHLLRWPRCRVLQSGAWNV